MSVISNINEIRRIIPPEVTIVAVSKTRTVDEIMEAYQAGIRNFGENRVQELMTKKPMLPEDIRWHFIGHLQRNKARMVVPAATLIHSLDSAGLLNEIQTVAEKSNKAIDCLLQFHIATEETKFGMTEQEAYSLAEIWINSRYGHVNLTGVMGMASFTDDHALIEREFRLLKGYFDKLRTDFFMNCERFSTISMGMTGDYLLAIREGSNMVRIGTGIFGH